jgi:hypothetical protein
MMADGAAGNDAGVCLTYATRICALAPINL